MIILNIVHKSLTFPDIAYSKPDEKEINMQNNKGGNGNVICEEKFETVYFSLQHCNTCVYYVIFILNIERRRETKLHKPPSKYPTYSFSRNYSWCIEKNQSADI